MVSASELGGLMAMMPAFATDNGGDIDAVDGGDAAVRLAHGAQLEDGHGRADDDWSRCRLSMATGTRATRMIVKAGRAACS